MDTLTDRQQEILDFIRERIEGDGVPPSLAEIAQAFRFADPSSAQHFVAALEAKGALRREPGKRRNLRLVNEDGRSASRPGRRVPLVGRVAAGLPILAQENIERSVLLDPDMFRARADFALRVQGDSMRDAGILDGDLLAVRRTQEVRNGQIVVARVGDDVTVKRWRRRGHVVELLPENPDYAPIVLDTRQDEFALEGLGVGLIRGAQSL